MKESLDKDQRWIFNCSFCGKPRNEVRTLLSGPRVHICDQCVAQCNDILAKEELLKEEALQAARRVELIEAARGALDGAADRLARCVLAFLKENP